MAKGSIPVKAMAALMRRNQPARPPFNPAPLMIPALPVFDRNRESNPPPAPPVMQAAPASPASALPPVQPNQRQRRQAIAEQALSGPPIPSTPSSLPNVNEWGRWMKQTPVVGDAWGGIADYLSNMGTPNLSLKNAAAASFDMGPWGVAAKGLNAALTPMQALGIGAGANFVIPNPFEEPNPQRSVMDSYY